MRKWDILLWFSHQKLNVLYAKSTTKTEDWDDLHFIYKRQSSNNVRSLYKYSISKLKTATYSHVILEWNYCLYLKETFFTCFKEGNVHPCGFFSISENM